MPVRIRNGELMITIRDYTEHDASATKKIAFETIHQINKRDYTQAQLLAWAPISLDPFIWHKRMLDIEPFSAEINGQVVGYADLQYDGLIDHFFIHHQFQRQGIGRALMTHIFSVGKQKGVKKYYAMVSITAKPFFEAFGFEVVEPLTVEVREQTLDNFHMQKCVC